MTSSLPSTTALEPRKTDAIRVLIVDDHPVFRSGLRQLLESKGMVVCGECECAKTALSFLRNLSPQIVVIDIRMPGADGIDLIKSIIAEAKDVKVIVVSMYDESLYALRAMRAGAKGYICKANPIDQLVFAVEKVAAGGVYLPPAYAQSVIDRMISAEPQEPAPSSPLENLSDRELEIFHHVGNGAGTREIADALGLSIKTIETHRAHITEKLGFATSREMIDYATTWTETFAGVSTGRRARGQSQH